MTKKKIIIWILAGLCLLAGLIWIAGKRIRQNQMHRDGVAVEEPKFGNERAEGSHAFAYEVSDQGWSGLKMGDTGKTIGEEGDFLCCVCSVMSLADKTTAKNKYTPDKLNAVISGIDGYEEDGTFRSGVLKEIAENAKRQKVIVPGLTGQDLVRDPKDPDIVYDIVKVKKDGRYRWVAITGLSKDKKQYQCMDPKEETAVSLSDYDSRVYDWYTLGGLRGDVDLSKEGADILAQRKTWQERMRLLRRIIWVAVLILLSCIIGGKAERYRRQRKER
ncbi:MAG: hypothetical protein HFG38_09715 [Eubacterium sp.]|nr:hypothetical protein [Eubacterium sp.]